VFLLAHRVGLAEQRHQFLVQVFGPGQTKGVDITELIRLQSHIR